MTKKRSIQAGMGHTAISGKDLLCTDVKFDADTPPFADAHFIFVAAAPGTAKSGGGRTYATGRQINFKLSMNRVTSIAYCLEQCIRGNWHLFENSTDDGCPTFMTNRNLSKHVADDDKSGPVTKWIKIKPATDERDPGDPLVVEFMEGGSRIHFVLEFNEALELLDNLRQTVLLCKTLEMARRVELARRDAEERKEDQRYANLKADDEEVHGLSAADKAMIEKAGGKFTFADDINEFFSCAIPFNTVNNDEKIRSALTKAGYRYRHRFKSYVRKIVKYIDLPYGNVIPLPVLTMDDFGDLGGKVPVMAVAPVTGDGSAAVSAPAEIDMHGGLSEADYAIVSSMPNFDAKVIKGKVTFKGDARKHAAFDVLTGNGWAFSGAPNYRWEKK